MMQEKYDEYKALLRKRRLSEELDGTEYVRLAVKLGEWGNRGGVARL